MSCRYSSFYGIDVFYSPPPGWKTSQLQGYLMHLSGEMQSAYCCVSEHIILTLARAQLLIVNPESSALTIRLLYFPQVAENLAV